MFWKAPDALFQFDDKADPGTRRTRKFDDANAANLDQPGAAPGRPRPKHMLQDEKFDAVIGDEGCSGGNQP